MKDPLLIFRRSCSYFYLFFITALLNFCNISLLIAQISREIPPPSFTQPNISTNIQTMLMPPFNVDSLLKADSLNQLNDFTFKFGHVINVNFSLTNSGTLDTLLDGSLLWRRK